MTKSRANWGALPVGSSVSIFDVVNTAFKHLYVIGPNEKTAMAIARSANHILGTHEIHEDQYFRAPQKVDPSNDKNLHSHQSEIQLAIDRRLQGTLHFDHGHLFVGEEAVKA